MEQTPAWAGAYEPAGHQNGKKAQNQERSPSCKRTGNKLEATIAHFPHLTIVGVVEALYTTASFPLPR